MKKQTEKSTTIPTGHMRVGELAKKAGISINALRYYHKEGLLSPSSKSEGGYRLYNDQDMVRLIQIQTLKELGFTLSEIKKHLTTLDNPADMVTALTEHETAIEKRIEILLDSLKAIHALKVEVEQMQTMDFKRYADILANLQMKNENYWTIKYMDEDLLDYLRSHFENNEEGALSLLKTMDRYYGEIVQLQKDGVPPESEKGQEIAHAMLEMMVELTGGDVDLMQKFAGSVENVNKSGEMRSRKFKSQYDYICKALDAYIKKNELDSVGFAIPLKT